MSRDDASNGSTILPLELWDTDGCARTGAATQTCRWKCGSQCAHPAPNSTPGDTFEGVMQRFLSRRTLFRGAAVAAGAAAVAPHLTRPGAAAAQNIQAGSLAFREIALANEDRIIVPAGYAQSTLLRWGDPLFADSPAFDPNRQNGEIQAKQFGYNNDFIGFQPLPRGGSGASSALLSVNHEYTNPELMFPGYDAMSPTKDQVDAELAAHGLTVVEIARSGGQWSPVVGSRYNRRLTGTTPIQFSGPAAGHELLRTSDDPTGTRVLGTLNNCSAGTTPWGTTLTAEENFNQYFANNNRLAMDDPRRALHARYGLPTGASERKWETFYKRFDIAQEPNEPFRFGWMVEVDPYDPTSMPKKRTALGRVKHEAATFMVGGDGRVGVYMGDDERFDYVYKFVTSGRYNANDRAANMELLDAGTLYVAKFNDDGSGEWVALVQGQNGLTADKGFASQADVLIKTRQAGDAVGATKMDRPEDFEFNPVNKKIYIALTNNTNRTAAQVDKANPRANNRYGHIIELSEAGDNPTSTRFSWDIFMLCGPKADDSRYFAGYDKRNIAPISSPDNLVVDKAGNLWIFTDGQPGTVMVNDAVFAVPTAGPERGHLKPFLSAVPGAEAASGDLSTDQETLFVSIQHPGEGGSIERPISRWPDGTNIPRPSVVQAWKAELSGDSRVIGS